MNAWFWSAIFHTRDFGLTEKLDYSSAAALLGYSLILASLRTFNVKDEASRVMFAAPILAFVTTHILYLNFYELDYVRLQFLSLAVCQTLKYGNQATNCRREQPLCVVDACTKEN